MPPNIAIIITSTRTPRVGPSIATLIHTILKTHLSSTSPPTPSSQQPKATLSIVDLAPFNLPIFNEPRWSAEIASHDAYILLVPEYNFGMAGSTKNAIDYLKNEWAGKPAAVISYGIQGGKTASEQVVTSLSGVGLRVSKTRPQLAFVGGVGPDAFMAVGEGKLGDETRREWEEKHKGEIVQSLEEILEALANPPVEKKE
ncbi:hypothetical protein TgHK011_000748 [Trichoderma gracile]|nr:hypothetical protein TgHK011_000748 [Trichoderma gracile]